MVGDVDVVLVVEAVGGWEVEQNPPALLRSPGSPRGRGLAQEQGQEAGVWLNGSCHSGSLDTAVVSALVP